jgi:hypothetical protein
VAAVIATAMALLLLLTGEGDALEHGGGTAFLVSLAIARGISLVTLLSAVVGLALATRR